MRLLALCLTGGVAQAQPGADEAALVLGAAVLGAIATESLHIVFARRASTARYQSLRRALRLEVERVLALAAERRSPATASGVRFGEPLPTAVWDLLRSSGLADRLATHEAEELAAFQADTARANYLNAQLPLFLLLATFGPEDARARYLSTALAFSTEPYALVVASAQELLARLSESPEGRVASIRRRLGGLIAGVRY